MVNLRSLLFAAFLGLGAGQALAQAPPPVPALPDTERRTSYSISGTTCACSVGFALYGDSTDIDAWVEVWINGVRYLSTDASHGWALSSATGSLGTIPRPITNAVLTFTATQTGTVQIVGARRPRRTSQFNENRGVAARDLNQVITDLTAQNRETWDKLNDVTGRALVGIPGNSYGQLPAPSSCIGAFLGFDATGAKPVCQQLISTPGTISTPSTTVAGHLATWGNTTGNALDDLPISSLFANPTQSIDLTTHNGSAATGMRSDAAPPLSPSLFTSPAAAGSTLIRSVQSSGTSLFVNNSSGNDANSCLVIGSPCKTIQAAVTKALAIDSNGLQVTISVADGSWTECVTVNGTPVGGGQLFFSGDSGTPSNVTITCDSGNTFTFNGTNAFLSGFKLVNTTSGTLITAENFANVTLTTIEYGAAVGSQLEILVNSLVAEFGNVKISAGATSHVHVTSSGLYSTTATATLTGTPAFSAYFAGVAQYGTASFAGSFSGSATGQRFLAHNFGVVLAGSNGLTYLPGNVAGVANSYGQYLGSTIITNALSPQAFSALPTCAAITEGMMGAVTDSSTITWGATITGSSTSHVLAYCDGTNWTVAGK